MKFFDESLNDTCDSIGIMRQFKCSHCSKIDDYFGDNGECWEYRILLIMLEENVNLDLLEESDDEEDFQNVNAFIWMATM